ncbi:chloride channel protein [Alphaproteobacteria bacterium LSUCC0719]
MDVLSGTGQNSKKLGAITHLLKSIVVGIITGLGFGLVMAVVSNGFVLGVRTLSSLRDGKFFDALKFGETPFSFAPVVSLLIAVVAILVVRRVFAIKRWHGPADAIYAAHRSDNELDVKSGFGSTLAAFISASGGASVGQYGPLVHFGATVGSFLRQKTGGALSTDIFIGCGVAGAIAAGFNAPIAGIVFAHEAVLRHFSMRAIVPIAIASVSSVWFSNAFFGSTHIFDLSDVSINLGHMLPTALLAGPLFGLLAVLFMLAIRFSARFATNSGWSPLRLLLTAAIGTGVFGMFMPEVLGLGTSALSLMLDGGFEPSYLILLVVAKLMLTALCIGFGLFGGIFSPALFVGAAAGAVMGNIMVGTMGFGSITALSICGMAAVASAVIGAPVAGVLIILELTMNYDFALVAMISVVASIMVTNLVFGHSFFDRQLLDRGIDVSQGRGHIEMTEMPVLSVVDSNFCRISPNADVGFAIKELRRLEVTEAYVVDVNSRFHGKLRLHELLSHNTEAMVLPFADDMPISIKHDASLQQAIEVASDFVGESIPVINRLENTLVGVVTEADLFKLYLSLQHRVSDLERT